MTTEPFAPESGADPASDTAPIVPVTSEMMDHAAHAAAERADAVAHEPSETPSGSDDALPASAETPAPQAETPPAASEIAVAANQNAAPGREGGASGPLQAADLAFTNGEERTGRTADRTSRAASASADGLGLFNAKVMEIAAANMAAAGEFVSALLTAKTVPEAAAVNAQHMRHAFDTLTSQGRELMILGQKVVLDAARSSSEGLRRR